MLRYGGALRFFCRQAMASDRKKKQREVSHVKKNGKRVLSILLALVMVVLPLAGLADGIDGIDPAEFKGATLNVYNWGEYVDISLAKLFLFGIGKIPYQFQRICNPITHCISILYNHFATSTIFSPNAC